jgi:hypothetical protein
MSMTGGVAADGSAVAAGSVAAPAVPSGAGSLTGGRTPKIGAKRSAVGANWPLSEGLPTGSLSIMTWVSTSPCGAVGTPQPHVAIIVRCSSAGGRPTGRRSRFPARPRRASSRSSSPAHSASPLPRPRVRPGLPRPAGARPPARPGRPRHRRPRDPSDSPRSPPRARRPRPPPPPASAAACGCWPRRTGCRRSRLAGHRSARGPPRSGGANWTNDRQVQTIASPLFLRKSAMVLKSGCSRHISQAASRSRQHARSSARLERTPSR